MTTPNLRTGGDSIKKVISGSPLPALPASAIQLVELARDPDRSAADYAKPIETDAALAAQVLQFVNSSYFGFRHEVCSIPQGISLVGIRTIKNFVLWTAVFRSSKEAGQKAPSDHFAANSLRRALIARAVAKRIGAREAEEAFTAALFQDFAIPLLAKHFGEDYQTLVNLSEGSDQKLAELEREALGWTHADAACELLARWSLPSLLQDYLREHSWPEKLVEATDSRPGPLAVAVSSLAPCVSEDAWRESDRFTCCLERLGLADESTLEELLAEIDEDYASLTEVMRVGSAARKLIEQYKQEPLAPSR